MKAARLHGVGDIRVEDVPAPGVPEPGWVRIRVEAAGICGSDLHNWRTGQWISRAPSTPGHELAGTVTAVGADVTGFAPGDRVVADSRFWCGACAACRAGRRQLCERLGFVGEVCDGGFAEETVLPARLLHAIPDDLPAELAALAEPLAVALHAVRRLAAEPGAPVLVVGCGPIGGLAALVLAAEGRPVLVADRNDERAALVASVTGALPVALDRDALSAATDGTGVRFAVEATGNPAALSAVVDLVGGGGRVALVGIYHGRIDLDPNHLVEREVALVGCHAFADEMPAAVDAIGRHRDALARFLDRTIGIDEVPDAYARLAAGHASGLKTIVRP